MIDRECIVGVFVSEVGLDKVVPRECTSYRNFVEEVVGGSDFYGFLGLNLMGFVRCCFQET